MRGICRKTVALVIALALPVGASAGPLTTPVAPANAPAGQPGPIRAAIARSGRDLSSAQGQGRRSRGRFWASIALLAGGATLATIGTVEVTDKESGPDDDGGADDGPEKDGWAEKAMLGGGIAAAALGTVLLMSGKNGGPSAVVRRGGVTVVHTFRF